ncbi:RimK family protein [Reinekea marinisedimentorum]|uniref:Glutathione synthase/RimK-type ligase-like ATP-grasp enzyme n=1 Tax=Reinekea marinisedimentorum TaxID=230495 RepID=A0A4R3I5N6_9GAMM|nr:RimK family protein [Reinekea marinisedimentorum]TCS40441.1 glutathione synthase/RimK-type ligase-like ATP-grasp enzyme [Reinekea marinisedimentorum]
MYKTLIVSDELSDLESIDFQAISFKSYLTDYPKKSEPKTRVINLCDTANYLSQGYYCSLLAEARQHQVMPSLKVVNALRTKDRDTKPRVDISHLCAKVGASVLAEPQLVMFGMCQLPELAKISGFVFNKYQAPLLRLSFSVKASRTFALVERVAISSLSEEEKAHFKVAIERFTQSTWRSSKGRKMRWDLAILVNPSEPSPPSNSIALNRFVKAARKFSINATLVTKDELTDLSHFDALFIRETTAIDHHTYELAIKAENEGLVVIDDPQSILRCCNKAFLHDAFSYQKVPSPNTRILHEYNEDTLDELEREFGFPMVLKMPEGSFSRGVYKAKNRDELHDRLTELFQFTALVLVQEYMFTEFDWRIGVLNGRPLYACRYKMARGHWQIYNHDASKRNFSGGWDTLPTFEVPKYILDAALKACRIIGDGLYGVDIKSVNGKPYVIEVNDNPSLESGVEDAYLGKELYMQIMAEFQQRLEARGRI